MKVAIIDYGSGNLRSAAKAFECAAAYAGLGAGSIRVTDRPDEVAAADRIVLPGVGAFADCKRGVAAVDGLRDAIEDSVRAKARPFLGICVGMQLMAKRGLEHGACDGFGWIDGDVAGIAPDDESLKIPHMGWNALRPVGGHPLFNGVDSGRHAYFVHSFAMRPADARDAIANVDYGGAIVAAVGRDNLVGTQFHPEKSQTTGAQVIRNFLLWSP